MDTSGLFFKTGPQFDLELTDSGAGLVLPETKPPYTVDDGRVYIETPAGRAMIDPTYVAGVVPGNIGQCIIVFKGGSGLGCNLAANLVIDALNAVPREPSVSESIRAVSAELQQKIRSIGVPTEAVDAAQGKTNPWNFPPLGPRGDAANGETNQPATLTDAQRSAISNGGNIPAGAEV